VGNRGQTTGSSWLFDDSAVHGNETEQAKNLGPLAPLDGPPANQRPPRLASRNSEATRSTREACATR
jgi:hypothetical protein